MNKFLSFFAACSFIFALAGCEGCSSKSETAVVDDVAADVVDDVSDVCNLCQDATPAADVSASEDVTSVDVSVDVTSAD